MFQLPRAEQAQRESLQPQTPPLESKPISLGTRLIGFRAQLACEERKGGGGGGGGGGGRGGLYQMQGLGQWPAALLPDF